jgi:acyl-CoA synthetase (AMP-forming)/AMP-acid ligase II
MLAGRVGTGNVTIRHLSLSSDQGPAAASLVALLRSRAETAGDAVSHRFLRDGLEVTGELTYAGLDRRARAAAVELLTRAKPGDRVLLVYPPGLEFLVGFFGSLYAGMIPVPAYPPRPPQIDERLRAIAGDARPAVAASSLDIVERLGGQVPLGDALAPLDCLALETVPESAADEWLAPAADLSTVAHLQYTSGSTAVPKGVVVTHGNILSNLADLDGGWRHDEASTIVSWLPAFHDMGLVYGLLMPIYARIPCILMPPVIFLQRPVRWLQAITKFAGTHTAAPNFAYDHCARRVKPEDHGSLDLSRWRVAVNGAEPVRPDTIDRFCATFAGAGFKRNTFAPGFGLAEATLKVTAAQSGEGPTVNTFDGRTLVGCGAPILDTVVSIVDPSTREPVADGETAEIWVGGPSVAAGYWQRPEESAETFGARTAAGAGPFLRTGDLGFVSGGQLYVAGRIKDLLIIRGQNYYPQDLELTAERSGAHVRAGCGAAFSVERDGEERLVVVFEVERTLKPEARAGQIDLIRAAIVRDHELNAGDVVLLRAGAVPKTSSGKIQRRACRAAYLDGTLDQLTTDVPRGDA